MTHADIATALGNAIGRRVRFESIPAKEFIAMVTGAGMPQWRAEGLAEDYGHYDRGEAGVVTDARRAIRDVAAFGSGLAPVF